MSGTDVGTKRAAEPWAMGPPAKREKQTTSPVPMRFCDEVTAAGDAVPKVLVRGRGEEVYTVIGQGSVQINDDCCLFDFDEHAGKRIANQIPGRMKRKTRNAAIAACNDIFRNAADAIFRDMHRADLGPGAWVRKQAYFVLVVNPVARRYSVQVHHNPKEDHFFTARTPAPMRSLERKARSKSGRPKVTY